MLLGGVTLKNYLSLKHAELWNIFGSKDFRQVIVYQEYNIYLNSPRLKILHSATFYIIITMYHLSCLLFRITSPPLQEKVANTRKFFFLPTKQNR